MLCAISGETPQQPVASIKTGTIYEKALIEKYIAENGRDPITNEQLSTDDLIELKTERVVRPRPPTLTSIPALLSVFQNEWDALALESYNTQKQLQETRQELSVSLYQNDAAVRVIARLIKERDEARGALAKIGIGAGGAIGDSMQVDQQPLSEELVAKIEQTHDKLSKTRRKRAVPEDWANEEQVSAFQPLSTKVPKVVGASSMALDSAGDIVLIGSENSQACLVSMSLGKPVYDYAVDDGVITSVVWAGNKVALASSTGHVSIWNDGKMTTSFTQHAGKATALAAHPSGDLLASVGVDKSIILYDVVEGSMATQIFTNSSLLTAAFHPDGQLLAAGAVDGQIKIYDIKSGTSAADFDTPSAVTSLAFSENGTWLASASQDQTKIQIWNLRKMQEMKTLEVGSSISAIAWDYTGQFLAAGGPSGVVVFYYSKDSKEWSEPLKTAVPAQALSWGLNAQALITLGPDGTVSRLTDSE